MKFGWILGWAVPETWFAEKVRAAFPADEHRFVAAGPQTLEQLVTAGPVDWMVGYSLGSLVLLLEADRAASLGRVALLAPIWSLPSEEKMGGRVARAQIRALANWVRRDEEAAVADFYDRAGLEIPEQPRPAESREQLLWGLAALEKLRVDRGLPAAWSAWCGENDVLINAEELRGKIPELHIVPQATHAPDGLLAAFSSALAAETGRAEGISAPAAEAGPRTGA